MTLIALFSSCSLVPISGYKTFRSNEEGFRISFEYPSSWRAGRIQVHEGSSAVIIFISDTSTVGILSEPTRTDGGTYANAAELIEHSLSVYTGQPELEILSRGKATLDTIESEELTLSYRFHADRVLEGPPISTPIDKTVIIRDLATEYKGRIYSIMSQIDADQYDSAKPGFEHLLTTFRFLD